MKLKLKNPILFFDIESTGLNIATDRIVEISVVKVHPDGEVETKTRRINPTIPISPEAQAVHGISDEDVKDCPTFKQVAKSLAQWMSGCDIAGYNSTKFDIPLLAEEFLRADVPDFDFRKRKLVDVQTIFHKMEPRNLKAAYRFYCNQELENAHAAEADTLATYEVLKGQLDRYPELKNDTTFLANFSTMQRHVDYAGRLIYGDNDEPVISFGKHKGKTARAVYFSEPSYFAWIDNGDFTLDTKRQFSLLKAQFEAEKKAASAESRKTTTVIPKTKGYTPFETLGDLFSQEKD